MMPVSAEAVPPLDAGSVHRFLLEIPKPKILTSVEDLQLARGAVAANPASERLRYKLVSLLVQQDYFEEALGLLRTWNLDDPRFLHLMVECLVSQENETANLEILTLCERALALGADDLRRAHSLAMLAKAQIRLGRLEEGRQSLDRALSLDPASKDAYKRAAVQLLNQGAQDELLDQAEEFAARGIIHARIIAAQSLALTQLDRMDEARAMQGLGQFLSVREPAAPEGWPTLAVFNDALADEVRSHPDSRFNRYGTASAQTWRIDFPELTRTPLIPQLQRLIQREVEEYVAALPPGDHPFLKAKPASAWLRNWCVMTEGDGHETWHVHQNGWLSGVYYIYVPDHIAQGTGVEGCISFGLPEDVIGEQRAKQFGERICRPYTGLMMLFPSHAYHRTYPHQGEGRRICYAFDIVPHRQSQSS